MAQAVEDAVKEDEDKETATPALPEQQLNTRVSAQLWATMSLTMVRKAQQIR